MVAEMMQKVEFCDVKSRMLQCEKWNAVMYGNLKCFISQPGISKGPEA